MYPPLPPGPPPADQDQAIADAAAAAAGQPGPGSWRMGSGPFPGQRAPQERMPYNAHRGNIWHPAKGKSPEGWKVIVRDLCPGTQPDDLRRWMDDDRAFDECREDIVDINCHGGAHSGAVMAFITFRDSNSARVFFTAAYKWWAYCPEDIDERGWRMCGIQYARP